MRLCLLCAPLCVNSTALSSHRRRKRRVVPLFERGLFRAAHRKCQKHSASVYTKVLTNMLPESIILPRICHIRKFKASTRETPSGPIVNRSHLSQNFFRFLECTHLK